MKHGFVKVAAAAPEIKVADPQYNAQQIIETMRKSDELGVKLLVLPALSLTGTTCGDLFYQNTLLQGAAAALRQIVTASIDMGMLTFVGLPVARDGKVYNCAAAVYGGDLLGVDELRGRQALLRPGGRRGARGEDRRSVRRRLRHTPAV